MYVPEQPNAKTDHYIVEGVEAHHAHQQVLQNHLQIKRVALNRLDHKEVNLLIFLVLRKAISFMLFNLAVKLTAKINRDGTALNYSQKNH